MQLFSFNGIRSLIGGAVLIPVIFIIDRIKPSDRKPSNRSDRKRLVIGGICCGTVLFLASSAQQLGLYMGTPAGKAGFLTACYILLVPILSLFLKKKCGWNIWLGIVIAVVGLYLLCMSSSLSFQSSDLMVLGTEHCFLQYAITCDRPFLTACGRSQNVMYTVLGMRDSQHIPGVFLGDAS